MSLASRRARYAASIVVPFFERTGNDRSDLAFAAVTELQVRCMQVELDLVHTLAFGGLALMLGYAMRRWIPVLARYNLPPPVLGGLVVAVAILVTHSQGEVPIKFDTTLQTPLQNTFFASVGFGASVLLLKRGGPLVLLMMVVATLVAALQNVLGAVVAYLLGEHPLMGVLAGSVTLTGGPATGLAFAPLFEQAGVSGASTLAVSAAMVGIVSGGLMGGPIGTYLLDRHPRRVHASRSPRLSLRRRRQ